MRNVPKAAALAAALAAGFWSGMCFERSRVEHLREIRLGRHTGEVWLLEHAELRDGAYTSCAPIAVVEIDAEGRIAEFKGDRCNAALASRRILEALHEK